MTDPSSPHPDLATWLEPAVMTALDEHPWMLSDGKCYCGETATDGYGWLLHVAPLVAAHIAQALPDYPGELSHQEQDSPDGRFAY